MDPIEELGNDELFEIVWAVREALWPSGNRNHEWSADTLDAIASEFVSRDLTPPFEEE